MAQVLFFALLVITLLAGAFAYYSPLQKDVNPFSFMMDSTGYKSMETLNIKRIQQINVMTRNGIMRVRKQMDDLALTQNNFLDTIKDQQRILKGAGKDAEDVLAEAKREGKMGDKDILQLEALASQMQDDQRLLVDHGNDLISLNDQVTKSREEIAEQIDLANFNTESSLRSLRQRFGSLKNQASELFNKINEQKQDFNDRMYEMRAKLQTAFRGAVGQHSIREHIQRMLDKEHEDMMKLADLMADSKERLKDLLQDSKDLIEDEHQRQEEQQSMLRQRIEDQKQQMQDDQQNSKNLIEDEHQRQEEQQSMLRQRIEDQKQQMQDDQQNSKNLIEDEHQRQEEQQSMLRQRIEDQKQRMQDQQK